MATRQTIGDEGSAAGPEMVGEGCWGPLGLREVTSTMEEVWDTGEAPGPGWAAVGGSSDGPLYNKASNC